MTENRKAIIQLDEGSRTRGTVINVIVGRDLSFSGWILPENQLLWDATNYNVVIDQTIWEDGVFLDAEYIPTPEENIFDLQTVQGTQLTGEDADPATLEEAKKVAFQSVQFARRMLQREIQTSNMGIEEILEYADILPAFKGDMFVSNGDYVRYGSIGGRTTVYRVYNPQMETFVTSANITPDSEFNPPFVLEGVKNGVRYWCRPLGKSDSYQVGEQVWFEGAMKTCTIPDNMFSPAEHGWK